MPERERGREYAAIMAISQNGFPVLSADSKHLHKWVVPGTERYFVMRSGSVGFILAHLALWYHEKLDRLDGGTWDEWGYAYRPVRGSETFSNHASGTAMDLDATQWPLSTTHMSASQRLKIRARLRVYSGVIRWGGDYSGRKDEMHYEIVKSLTACEKVAKRLVRTSRGKRILQANPGQERVIKT